MTALPCVISVALFAMSRCGHERVLGPAGRVVVAGVGDAGRTGPTGAAVAPMPPSVVLTGGIGGLKGLLYVKDNFIDESNLFEAIPLIVLAEGRAA